MPQTIRDFLLAQDIQDPDALAKKADALFQSQQSASVHFLSDNPTASIYAIRPPKPRTHSYSNSSTSQSYSPEVPALWLPLTTTRGLPPLYPLHAGPTVRMESKPRSSNNLATG